MAKSPRGLSPEDAALWQEIARTVRPLRRRPESNPITAPVERGQILPAGQIAAPAQSVSLPTGLLRPSGHGSTLGSAAPRVTLKRATPITPPDRGGERKVRRGKVDIDGRLDLHGHTQDSAFAALTAFLYAAHGRGAQCVLVVTGKGGRGRVDESAPGILKRRLPEWLAAPGLQPLVSGMAGANRRHGGDGAAYVFLRRLRPTAQEER